MTNRLACHGLWIISHLDFGISLASRCSLLAVSLYRNAMENPNVSSYAPLDQNDESSGSESRSDQDGQSKKRKRPMNVTLVDPFTL